VSVYQLTTKTLVINLRYVQIFSPEKSLPLFNTSSLLAPLFMVPGAATEQFNYKVIVYNRTIVAFSATRTNSTPLSQARLER
jgi:hypothetical protein